MITLFYLGISNFDLFEQNPLSKFNIFINDLILTIYFMIKQNPSNKNKSIIDYNIFLYAIPMNLIGLVVGRIVDRTFPKIIIILFMIIVMIFGFTVLNEKIKNLKIVTPLHENLFNYLKKDKNSVFEISIE